MLADKPGARFATNLVALEASKADTLADILSINTLTNPALRVGNMLAQVPVNRTGTHFLALDGGPLYNYYTRNSNAATEAKSGLINIPTPDRRSKVKRSTRLTAWEDGYEKPRTQAGIQAKTDAHITLKSEGTDGIKSLVARYGFADGKNTKDAVNLMDIGNKSPFADLVPVMFNLFGDSSTRIAFRGFIQNLTDNFNGNWQGTSYVGRMEQFFTYTGFTRTLTFQLVVPIFSEAEQPIVYNKVNSLLSYTAPTYSNNLPQGNIISMVIGNYIKSHGFIGSVSSTLDNNVPWSYSAEGEYETTGTRLLPQVLTLNIQFTPIHSKAPETYTTKHTKGASATPFINHNGIPYADIKKPASKELTNLDITQPTRDITRVLRVENTGRNILQNLGRLFRRRQRPLEGVAITEDGTFDYPDGSPTWTD